MEIEGKKTVQGRQLLEVEVARRSVLRPRLVFDV